MRSTKSRVARVITRHESYEITERAEDLGLAHVTVDAKKECVAKCNCCSCCCIALSALIQYEKIHALVHYIKLRNNFITCRE